MSQISPQDQQHLAQLTSQAAHILVWIIAGVIVLWVLGFIGEQVQERLKPNLMILMTAVFVGIIFLNVIHA